MQKINHYHRKKKPQGMNAMSSLLASMGGFRDATGMDALSKLTSEQIQAVSQNNANLTNAANLMANNAHQYSMNKQAVKDGFLHPKDMAASAREGAKTEYQKEADAYNKQIETIMANPHLTTKAREEALTEATRNYIAKGKASADIGGLRNNPNGMPNISEEGVSTDVPLEGEGNEENEDSTNNDTMSMLRGELTRQSEGKKGTGIYPPPRATSGAGPSPARA